MFEPTVDLPRPQEHSPQLLTSVLAPYNVSPKTLSTEAQQSIKKAAAEPQVKEVMPKLLDAMNNVHKEIPAANTPEHQAGVVKLMQGIDSGTTKPDDLLTGVQKEVASQADLSPEDKATIAKTLQTLQAQQHLPPASRSPEVVTGALQSLMRIGKVIFIALAAVIGFGLFKGMSGMSAGGGQQ